LDSDNPGPSTSTALNAASSSSKRRHGPLLGAIVALLFFITWAAVGFAAVDGDAPGVKPASSAAVLAARHNLPRAKPKSPATLAVLIAAGFLPAVLLAAQARRRPS